MIYGDVSIHTVAAVYPSAGPNEFALGKNVSIR
jgi:hypothetical protein